MKPFYSILFATLNPITSERISVGLLFVDGYNIKFKTSSQKQKIIGSFLDSDSFQLLKLSLKQISNIINQKSRTETAIRFPTIIDHYFSSDYISYLSKYSHNTLQFSGPEQIDRSYSDELFKSLYERFVFKGQEIREEKVNLVYERIKKNLYPRINTKVNIDIRLSEEILEKVIVPIDVNFIGKNGSPVIGKVFDFSRRINLIHNSISDYVSLIKSFELMKDEGKFFVLGDEPKKTNSKNHKLWSHVNDLGIMDFVNTKETDRIADYILKNSVEPYFAD